MLLIKDLEIKTKEWGTFKDSLKAPVHRWFTYPAGFSYRAVENAILHEGLTKGNTIYDPFMGSGTTNIAAKVKGLNSIGVEAHPFVFPITQSKMAWDIDRGEVNNILSIIENKIATTPKPDKLTPYLIEIFPELILKCYLVVTLFDLLLIRDELNSAITSIDLKRFLRTALISTLRDVSMASTGWPYIAPNKIKISSKIKDAFPEFKKRTLMMLQDLDMMRALTFDKESEHSIFLGDSRNTTEYINDNSADLIFTSPPYLNNFDYADRTRLEMYFMGDAKNWGEISSQVRTVLMTHATTQISRGDKKYNFLEDFKEECPEPYSFLNIAVKELAKLRNEKGGKKSYDLMVSGYFNDIYQILKDNYRILKPDTNAYYILGDSAPYGVYIPTDKLIGDIGVCIGFKSYKTIELRKRGDKWKNNPQRHSVSLKESIIILTK